MGRRPQQQQTFQLLLLQWLLLALSATPPLTAAAATAATAVCQPQPGLGVKLELPYHPAPRRVELPFCGQFGCSCCTIAQSLALARASQPVLADDDLSPACKEAWLKAVCRVCDPEVGTGVKRSMCASTCDALYTSCKEDFFAYDPSSGLVSPCTAQVEGQLVCSQLSELAGSAEEFCATAGFGAVGADGSGCYDGSPVGPESCPAAPPPAPASSSSKQRRSSSRSSKKSSKRGGLLASWLPWKLKRRQRQQLAAAGDLMMGTLIAAGMAWAVVAVLQRIMQPSLRRPRLESPDGPPPTNAREVLARAAEARRRAGHPML